MRLAVLRVTVFGTCVETQSQSATVGRSSDIAAWQSVCRWSRWPRIQAAVHTSPSKEDDHDTPRRVPWRHL